MQTRLRSCFAALLIFLISLSSCGKPPDTTLTIIGNLKVDGKSTDAFTNFFGGQLDELFLSPLVEYDPFTNTYYPVLLKEAVSKDGGRAWEIKIRQAHFHEGSMVTSDDIIFSIEKLKELTSYLSPIIHTEKLDLETVRLTFKDPVTEIGDVICFITVYPRHILKKFDSWREGILKRPVGSGPFKFSRWLENGIELKANEQYFDGRPKVDKLVYLYEEDENKRLGALLNGTADLISAPLPPETANFLKKDPRFYVNEFSNPYFFNALFLDNNSLFFADSRVRKAVNMAINRDVLIDKALSGSGTPVYSSFPADMLPADYRSDGYFYDPKTAVELLNKAGWKERDSDGVLKKKGTRFLFKLCYPNSSHELSRVASVIAQQLYEVGIEVKIAPVEYSEYVGDKFLSLKYDALLEGRGAYYPDVTWESRKLYGKNNYNYSNYSNKTADTLFEDIKKTSNPYEKKAIYATIDRLIHDDAPAVFLYSPVHYSAANKRFQKAKEFKGISFDTYKLKDWEP